MTPRSSRQDDPHAIGTISTPVAVLAVRLPAQRAIAQRFSAMAPFDIRRDAAIRTLLGVKRKWLAHAPHDADDPTETNAVA